MRDALVRIFRNGAYLTSGKGMGGLIQFANLALAARAMGAVDFGVLMLVHSYALAASGLAKFQSWQAIVQFGAGYARDRKARPLLELIAFAVLLDGLSGLVVAGLAAALVPFLGPRFGLDAEQIPLALAYCSIIPTMTAAAPTGVLRLLDRFRALAGQSLVTPIIRLGGILLTSMLGGSLVAFIFVWWASDLIGDLVLWRLAYRALKSEELLELRGVRPTQAPRTNPGLWKFVAATNVNASIALSWSPVSSLIVGALGGPAAAGGFRVVLSLVEALAKPADLLTRTFYPELAHFRAAGELDAMRSLGRRAAMLMTPLALALTAVGALAGPWLIENVMGKSFTTGGSLVDLLSLSILVTLPAFALDPMLIALHRAGWAMLCRVLGSICYFGALVILIPRLGLTGAGWAYLLGCVSLAAIQVLVLKLAWLRVGAGREP